MIGVRRVSLVIHCKPFSTLPEFILMRWLLEDRTWSSEEPTMWSFNIHPSHFWGGAEVWVQSPMANDLINQAYLLQLIKTLSNDTQKSFHWGAGQVTHVEKAWKLNVPLPYLALCIFSICLFLSSILNNLVIVFPRVLGRVTENYWTWERSCGKPWFIQPVRQKYRC